MAIYSKLNEINSGLQLDKGNTCVVESPFPASSLLHDQQQDFIIPRAFVQRREDPDHSVGR